MRLPEWVKTLIERYRHRGKRHYRPGSKAVVQKERNFERLTGTLPNRKTLERKWRERGLIK